MRAVSYPQAKDSTNPPLRLRFTAARFPGRAVIAGSLLAAATVVGMLYAWSEVSNATASYTSRPGAVYDALRTWMTSGVYRGYIVTTLSEACAGFALAVVIAAVLAVALSSSRLLTEVASPLVRLLNITPRVALAPVFLLVFGIGYTSKLYFVIAVVFIIPFYAMVRALATIDPVLKDHARILGASRLAMARDVHVPAVLGAVIASLRVSVGFSLLASVFAEIIASNSGIGYEIAQAELSSEPSFVIAGIVIVAVIGFLIDRILLLVERRFSAWKVSA